MNIPVLLRPRRLLDLETWSDTTLDIFDPFDELDQEVCRDLLWLRKPTFRHEITRKPVVPVKYRLNIDVRGYKPETISSEIQNGKLLVSGYDEVKEENDYNKIEFRKSFQLPRDLDVEKMVSFLTKRGHMIVEIPYEVSDYEEPEVHEQPDGSGKYHFKMSTRNVDLSKLHVTMKDKDLIIKCEDLQQFGEDNTSKIIKLRLPENLDVHSLRCYTDADYLKIHGDLKPQPVKYTHVPLYEADEPLKTVKKTLEHCSEVVSSTLTDPVSHAVKDLIRKISLKTSQSYPCDTPYHETPPQQYETRSEHGGYVHTVPELFHAAAPVGITPPPPPPRPLKTDEKTTTSEFYFPQELEAPSVVDELVIPKKH